MPVTTTNKKTAPKMLLEKYEQEQQELNDFITKHADVLEKVTAMQLAVSETMNILKEAVRESGQGLEGNKFTVRFTPRRSVVYNFTKMAEVANEQELQIIKKRASSVVVDKTSLVKLVEKGLVRIEVERAGFEEIELTPAIMIKEKEQSND